MILSLASVILAALAPTPAEAKGLFEIAKYGSVLCSDAERTVSIRIVRSHMREDVVTLSGFVEGEADLVVANPKLTATGSRLLGKSESYDHMGEPIAQTVVYTKARIRGQVASGALDETKHVICTKNEFNDID